MRFDGEVKVGEIRIFADAKEPLTALVVRDCGLSGFRLVPVSPYRVPASECERVVGDRVFQLWNVCTAAAGFVRRSWIVDVLPPETVAEIREAAKAPLPAKLGDYERRQSARGGDFRSWTERCPARASFWRSYGGWSIAATFVIGLGVSWLVLHEPPRNQDRCAARRVMSVEVARGVRYPELEEPPAVAKCAAEEGPMPEVEVKVPYPEPPMAKVESAPRVKKLAEPARMGTVPGNLRGIAVERDAVVAAKTRAGDREAEVVTLLEGLKGAQRADGSWGQSPMKDTALAVIALMAHGETSDSAAFGKTLVNGVRWLSEAKFVGEKTEDVRMAACALCCASVAVPNPNVRLAAERTLAFIGDNRSVEAGRDWSGLLADLTRPSAADGASARRDAAVRPSDDAIADTCILVLKLLKK